MPINQYFLSNDSANHFHVIEEFEVSDGETAIVLDHLLNHIKVLHSVAGGVKTQDVAEALSRFRQYGVTKNGYVGGATPENVESTILNECLLLLQCFLEISSLCTDCERRSRIVEEMSERVSFLDYRYPNDAYSSVTERDA